MPSAPARRRRSSSPQASGRLSASTPWRPWNARGSAARTRSRPGAWKRGFSTRPEAMNSGAYASTAVPRSSASRPTRIVASGENIIDTRSGVPRGTFIAIAARGAGALDGRESRPASALHAAERALRTRVPLRARARSARRSRTPLDPFARNVSTWRAARRPAPRRPVGDVRGTIAEPERAPPPSGRARRESSSDKGYVFGPLAQESLSNVPYLVPCRQGGTARESGCAPSQPLVAVLRVVRVVDSAEVVAAGRRLLDHRDAGRDRQAVRRRDADA